MSGTFFPLKQDTAWYKIVPSKWLGWPNHHHEKARWQHCDMVCHNKLISVQFVFVFVLYIVNLN